MKTNILGFVVLGFMFFSTFMTGTILTNSTKDIYIKTMQTQNTKLAESNQKLDNVNSQLKAHNNSLYNTNRSLKITNDRLLLVIDLLQKSSKRGVRNTDLLNKLAKHPARTVIQKQPVKVIHVRVPVLVPVVSPAPQRHKKDAEL